MRVLRIAIAIAVVAVIAVYVRNLHWDEIGKALAAASVPLLVVSALGNGPLVWLKAQRLKLLVGGGVPTGRLMQIYFASYAADNLVMSQAGLGVRVAALARHGIALAAAVTTQVVEKVIEGIGLAVVATPLLASAELDPRIVTALRVCIGIGIGGTIALAVFGNMRATSETRRKEVWRRGQRGRRRAA